MAATGSPQSTARTFRFGPYELSERDGELRKHGIRIKLQDQPFRVLVELLANAGTVVSREELQQRLWPADTFVDFDTGLNNAIRKLRQALNDDADNPRYIETLAKRGYRFVAPAAVTGPVQAVQQAAVGGEGAVTQPAAVVAIDSPPYWRNNIRLWQLLAAGVVLLALGIGIAWWLRPTAAREAREQSITANPPDAPVTGAVISPDGKYVAYSDSTGVYIRHIESGETRPLELPKDSQAVPTGWYPDGTHLLLTMAESGQEFPGLWKASILGGNPTVLMEQASGGVVSPDGSKIAFLRANGAAVGVWVARSDGKDGKEIVTGVGPKEILSTGGWFSIPQYEGSWAPRLAWSPSGRRIAFVSNSWNAYGDPEESTKMTLRTVDVEGRAPNKVMASTKLRPPLAWAPDGRMLVTQIESSANGTSDMGVWALRVDEKTGTAHGNPVVLTRGAGRIGGLSASAIGKRLVLWRASTQPQVFITQSAEKGDQLGAPRRLTLDESGNIASAWTSDGSAVLFASNRGGSWKFFGRPSIKSRPMCFLEGGTQFVLPRLSPDGSHILYEIGEEATGGGGANGFANIMAMPSQGGAPRRVLQMQYLYNHQCARSPSNVCVLNTQHGRTVRFFTFDPATGTTQELTSLQFEGEAVNWSLSPDGQMLAYVISGGEPKVTFMDLHGQSKHEVELNGWSRANNVDWTANGKSVFVIAQSPSGASAVLEVDPTGKHEARLEGQKNVRFYWAIQSPDGKHVLLEQLTGENNVWMVENY